MSSRIPHLRVVVFVTVVVLTGFSAVSAFTLGWTDDEVTKGNVIGTWINFAMLAVGFWLGSSSGGKTRDSEPARTEVSSGRQPRSSDTDPVDQHPAA